MKTVKITNIVRTKICGIETVLIKDAEGNTSFEASYSEVYSTSDFLFCVNEALESLSKNP